MPKQPPKGRKPYRDRYAEYIAALPPGTPPAGHRRERAPTRPTTRWPPSWSGRTPYLRPCRPRPTEREACPGRMLAVKLRRAAMLDPNFDPNPARHDISPGARLEPRRQGRAPQAGPTDRTPRTPSPSGRAPVTAHGNREGLDGVLRAVLDFEGDLQEHVRETGRRYSRPRTSGRPGVPFQRHTRQHRKAGETAWDTAYRLAQEKRKR